MISNRHDKNRQESRRINRLIRAAGPNFIPIRVDEANQIIHGLLEAGDAAYGTVLSYERSGRGLQLTVFLHVGAPLSAADRAVLDRLQDAAKLSRFDGREAHERLKLRAGSVMTSVRRAGYVVKQLIRDVQAILADSRLQGLLAHA